MEASFLDRHPGIRDVLGVIVFIICVIIGTIFINNFVFRSFTVSGPSMETTLYTGDRLIVNRMTVTWAQVRAQAYEPERGEVIVFRNPRFSVGMGGEEYIVKRVVAREGERVQVQNGVVTVFNSEHPNGFLVDEEFNGEPGSPTSGEVDEVVPEGTLFVIGDHREGEYSFDSRNGLGYVPLHDIIGPVSLRIFPLTGIRLF